MPQFCGTSSGKNDKETPMEDEKRLPPEEEIEPQEEAVTQEEDLPPL